MSQDDAIPGGVTPISGSPPESNFYKISRKPIRSTISKPWALAWDGSPRIHFGLGKRSTIDSLTITWPSAHVDKLPNLPVDKIIAVKEGVGIVPRQFPKNTHPMKTIIPGQSLHRRSGITSRTRVPLDKEKGFVKDKIILRGAEHRWCWPERVVGTGTLGQSPLHHLRAGSLHPTIDTTETVIHDVSMRTSRPSLDARAPNQRYGLKFNLCPGAPAGCSRHERSPG